MAADAPGWPALREHIEANPVEGSPQDMRRAFAALAPAPVAGRRSLAIGGVECLAVGPEDGSPIVWLHGGGLVFGSPESHSALGECLASAAGRPVLLPRYALAPEHSWPAPLADLLRVIDALPVPVDLGGDSAGGQLALLAALDRPAAVRRLALVSPNTDRRGLSESRERNSPSDAMNDDEDDRRLARMAFGERLADHPDASPLARDLSSLPPLWITATSVEMLLDDTLLLIRKAGLAGVRVEAHIREGLSHMWPLWPDRLPAARDTLASIARFFARADG